MEVSLDRTGEFDSSVHLNDNKHHLLLCATGSVAVIKINDIIDALSRHSNLSIRLIFTNTAAQFLNAQAEEQPALDSIRRMPNVHGVYLDKDESPLTWTRGAKILHISDGSRATKCQHAC